MISIARATQKRWSPVVLLEQPRAGRTRRPRPPHGVERRLQDARLGRFKPMADFEWTWPKQLHRPTVERVFTLDFLAQRRERDHRRRRTGSARRCSPRTSSTRRSSPATPRVFITAADLILDLTGQDTARALQRRLRTYLRPQLLAIDEVGYLAYDAHAADLLFQVVSRRYEQKSIVITTNLPFKQWDTVFPNAACAVALIDRLTHHAEIITIEGRVLSQARGRTHPEEAAPVP